MEFRYDHPNVESEWHQKVKTISTIYYQYFRPDHPEKLSDIFSMVKYLPIKAATMNLQELRAAFYYV
jgi:hypothetical protein